MVRGGKSRAGDGEGGVIVTPTATIAVAAEAVIDIFHEHTLSISGNLIYSIHRSAFVVEKNFKSTGQFRSMRTLTRPNAPLTEFAALRSLSPIL
jgi:hypothetical protein